MSSQPEKMITLTGKQLRERFQSLATALETVEREDLKKLKQQHSKVISELKAKITELERATEESQGKLQEAHGKSGDKLQETEKENYQKSEEEVREAQEEVRRKSKELEEAHRQHDDEVTGLKQRIVAIQDQSRLIEKENEYLNVGNVSLDECITNSHRNKTSVCARKFSTSETPCNFGSKFARCLLRQSKCLSKFGAQNPGLPLLAKSWIGRSAKETSSRNPKTTPSSLIASGTTEANAQIYFLN